jgi:hypothetical protein
MGRRNVMPEDRERYAEDDPRHHTIKIRGMLGDLRDHLREDVSKVEDPRAEALFETTAEVLGGLIIAYEHYERGAEEAWRDQGPAKQTLLSRSVAVALANASGVEQP